MYLSRINIRNFRQFGDDGLNVDFQPGISVLAGPNDSGKTAIVDAIRYVLTTKDQEYLGIQPDDYHTNTSGATAPAITLTCEFDDLSPAEQATFLEYLTTDENDELRLIVQWQATPKSSGSRNWTHTTVSAGANGDGPTLDSDARHLLACAYLRPLRDAEREMSPGKGSRLSKVLTSFPGVENGSKFDKEKIPKDAHETAALSLAGLHEYLRHLVNNHSGVKSATSSLNDDYLSQISLSKDNLLAEINFVNGANDPERLRRILERLELNFLDETSKPAIGRYGLGSNNLLYMACELLLIAKEGGLPLLLIEEPEAHLHPQRQLQLMQFLEGKTKQDPSMQIIVSTHSPVLASKAKTANIVMVHGGRAFSLAKGKTRLSSADYGFLDRFLDATKSNLFFARGVMVVEGDAEELLLPTIARLIGRDLTKQGVSIVNVGSTALKRYTRIFQRSKAEMGTGKNQLLDIPVASLSDRDIMPDGAPEQLGIVDSPEDPKWKSKKRKWRTENDPLFVENSQIEGDDQSKISAAKEQIDAKLRSDDAQLVVTFPSDFWTFEYDLVRSGLGKQVFTAAFLAKNDKKIHSSTDVDKAIANFKVAAETQWKSDYEALSGEDLGISVYKLYRGNGGVSKALAAQYLAGLLEEEFDGREQDLHGVLPAYIIRALTHVSSFDEATDD